MTQPSRRSHKQAESYRRRKPLKLFPGQAAENGAIARREPGLQPRADYLVKLGIDAFRAQRLDDAAGYLTNALSLLPDHALAHNCLGIVRRAQGKLEEAISCYERALQHAPEYFEAHNNLGVACESCGNHERAALEYQAALRIQPRFAAARNNLGNVLTKQGRPDEAVEQLRLALHEQPGFAAAHNNLGLALSRLDRAAEAESCFRQALLYQSQFPEAFVNLGNVLRAKKQLDDAAQCYQSALQRRANYPAALSGLGNVLLDQHRPDEARRCYEEASRLDPQFAEAYLGQGNVDLELEQWSRAEQSFRRALECHPEYAEALNNLGSTYRAWGRFEQAERAFQDAVRVNPDLVAAHNNLGNLYRIQDRQDLAANSYRQVLCRQPDQPLAKLRISTLCPTVFNCRSEMDEYFERAQQEWSSLSGACEYRDLPELLTVANEPPYNLQFFAEDIRPLKQAYADIFRYTGPAFDLTRHSEKIRIGCVVTAGHEVAFLRLIWDSLNRMNREEFEVSIVCAENAVGKFRSAIQNDVTKIIGVPEQPHRILDSIHEQRFDVLYYFEICTDAQNYFLPHFRLAPIQVTSWGIQVTSGIRNVDYYLSSKLIEAPEADDHYSEQLVRAHTLLSYQRRSIVPAGARSRASFGFGSDDHLYICAQHLGKFHPDFDPILAEILRRDRQGKIVGTEDKCGYGAKRLRERWSRAIPDVAHRIILLPRLAQVDYLALLSAGDVLLDPLHFGGVSTTYDGFSLAKPIVTLPTRQHRGRYTAGCYARMAIMNCTAINADDYVRIAVQLGRNRDHRELTSATIRENSWRIFEDQESVREHERIFRDLVQRSNGI